MKENFIGNTKKYKEKLKEALSNNYMGFYGKELIEKIRFSADWPIPLDTPHFNLSSYYLENGKHKGIDIQVLKGTKVFAPEKGKIIYSFQFPEDHEKMANTVFKGLESGVCYGFCHIEYDSIAEHSNLNRGDLLCNVGEWIWKISKRTKISKEVKKVYGNQNHHLHISTYNPNANWRTPWKIPGIFDPLLIFKKLED